MIHKPSAQCAKAAQTGQAVLGQILRAFHYRDRHVFVRLYVQYVRPHIEFSTQAWSPWTEGDKMALEVQKKAVGIVSGLAAKTYEDKLKELGLQSLEERRYQADMHMMESWKVRLGLRWIVAMPEQREPVLTCWMLRKSMAGWSYIRSNFFSVRVTKQWNAIPINIKRLEPAWRFKKRETGACRLKATKEPRPGREWRLVHREQMFFTSFYLEHEEPDCSKQ